MLITWLKAGGNVGIHGMPVCSVFLRDVHLDN
jgi:hypothetical protein